MPPTQLPKPQQSKALRQGVSGWPQAHELPVQTPLQQSALVAHDSFADIQQVPSPQVPSSQQSLASVQEAWGGTQHWKEPNGKRLHVIARF